MTFGASARVIIWNASAPGKISRRKRIFMRNNPRQIFFPFSNARTVMVAKRNGALAEWSEAQASSIRAPTIRGKVRFIPPLDTAGKARFNPSLALALLCADIRPRDGLLQSITK